MAAIRRIGVVGSGQMGGGIAQTAAVAAKLPVILYDACRVQLDKQRAHIGMCSCLPHRPPNKDRDAQRASSPET